MKVIKSLMLLFFAVMSATIVSLSATTRDRISIYVGSDASGNNLFSRGNPGEKSVVTLLSIPADSIDILRRSGKYIFLGSPKRAFTNLNTSRTYIGADKVLPGVNHVPDILPYTGKGVVIGIIDCGIDPRHITFRDTDGNSRVATYIFTESSMEREDATLHADVYSTPEAIIASPVDPSEGGHGTHTASTAAGSWNANPYMGIAPDAELFLVGTGQDIYDDEIIYGMQAVSDYGLKVHKPTVMSLSLGSGQGPRDGTSPVGLVSKAIAERGHAICFSAGNEGQRISSIKRNFSLDSTTIRSMFQKYHGGDNHIIDLQAWSMDTRQAEIQIMLAHRDKIQYTGQWFSMSYLEAHGGKITLVSKEGTSDVMPELKNWLQGELTLEMGIYEPNGRFYLDLNGIIDSYTPGDIPLLAFAIRSPQGADMRIYANAYYNTLVSWEAPGFMYGNADESISDFATSPYVIGVGMINGRNEVRTLSGETVTLQSMKFGALNEPNRYSSHGTTLDGKTLPHILAPGSLVVAALYPEAPGMENNYVCDTIIDGHRYFWGHDSGTSMSSPTAAGTIALWLEAIPTLTHAQIDEILANSSKPDVLANFPKHSRYGCIDAYAGLKYALRNFGVSPIVNSAPQRLSIRFLDNSLSPGSRIECLASQSLTNGIAEFIAIDGRIIRSQHIHDSCFETDLPSVPGIYILRVQAPGFSATQKIAVGGA